MAREETVKIRMTRGERFMLEVKAVREGRSLSELVRQAVQEYNPMEPKPSYCLNCPEESEEDFWDEYFADTEAEIEGKAREKKPEPERVKMEPIWHSETRKIILEGITPDKDVEHDITYTGIPAEKCPVCGTVTVDFGLLHDIEEAEIRVVNHYTRRNQGWPKEISLEELSRLM